MSLLNVEVTYFVVEAEEVAEAGGLGTSSLNKAPLSLEINFKGKKLKYSITLRQLFSQDG